MAGARLICYGTCESNNYRRLRDVYGDWICLGEGMIDIFEFDNSSPDHRSLGFADIYTFPVYHIDSSIGYRLETSGGVSVVYTGDTGYCRSVVDLSREANLLICESSFPDSMKVKGHLTPSIAGEIGTKAQVKHLLLTRFYPECDDSDIERECWKTYGGLLTLGRDLLEIRL